MKDHQSSVLAVPEFPAIPACQSGSKVLSPMFLRLTKARRLRAGLLVALVYMLCILAPTLSFAFPGSHAVSPCLTDANHVPGMMYVHAESSPAHLHADGHTHDHATAHSHASDGIASIKASAPPEQTPSKGSHSTDGQCCGLMCLSALPATLVQIVTPSVLTASQEVEGYLEVADNGPSRHYRPPIA
jgi:hypothetical protein